MSRTFITAEAGSTHDGHFLVLMQFGLAMTVADCVFLAIALFGGVGSTLARLVVAATILVGGVTGGVLAGQAVNPRANAFLSGISLAALYLVLDTAALAAFLVFGWGVPATWLALQGRLGVNAVVILLLGTLVSAVIAAVLERRGPTAPAGWTGPRPRDAFIALPFLVLVLSGLVRDIEIGEGATVVWALVAAVVLMGGLVAWRRWKATGYRRYCQGRSFRYRASFEETDDDLAPVLDALDPESRRTSVVHMIAGQWNGHPFTAFEYADVKGEAALGVVAWPLATRPLPDFVLTPTGLGDRIRATFGAADIDFDTDPEFSSAYLLRSDDEAAVRAVFTPDVRRVLLAGPGQRVAAAGRHLAWWVKGGLPGPRTFDAFLGRADAVRRAFGR